MIRLMIGETVGSYRITEQVSVGGMGTVYRAEHILIGKFAAIKVLHPELRNNTDVVSRFFNEAKATTQIRHPGIVEIFDFGYLPSGDGYIIMEFLEGSSIAQLLINGPLGELRATSIMRSVCSALAAAHALDIIHRDLKPDNVFVCPDSDAPGGERSKLLDFGIAKLSTPATRGGPMATQVGIVMGTPTYMSPEQCRGAGEVDHRADLYSIGCMLYEMICGAPPFVAAGAGELIAMHLFVAPEPPSTLAPSISPTAERLILQLLAKDPEERPKNAAELGRQLFALAYPDGSGARTPVAGVPVAWLTTEIPIVAPEPTPAPTPAPVPAAPVVMTSTTLSGAASQSTRARRSLRMPIWIGGAIAVIIAAVLGFTFASSHHDDAPVPAAPTAPIRAAVAPTVVTPTVVAPPPVETPPAPVEPLTPAIVARPVVVVHKRPVVPAHHAPDVAVPKPSDPGPPGSKDGSAAPPKILIEKDL